MSILVRVSAEQPEDCEDYDNGEVIDFGTRAISKRSSAPSSRKVTKGLKSKIITIRYLGHKRDVGPIILQKMNLRWKNLGQLDLVDAFAGSGSFTLRCGNAFRRITVNDRMLYSYELCLAVFTRPQLTYQWPPLPPQERLEDGFITQNYCTSLNSEGVSRRFFKQSNGRRIDFYRTRFFLAHQNGLSDEEFHYDMGCLVLAADRVANVETSYYSFVQQNGTYTVVPTSIPSEGRFRPRAAEDIFVHPPAPGEVEGAESLIGRVTVLNRDATLVSIDPAVTTSNSVLYLDPPYNYRPYFENNHLLYVIADPSYNPQTHGTVGLPPVGQRPPHSVWEQSQAALRELNTILSTTRANRIVFSYMRDGAMSVEHLSSAFQQNGWRYELSDVPAGVDGEIVIMADKGLDYHVAAAAAAAASLHSCPHVL